MGSGNYHMLEEAGNSGQRQEPTRMSKAGEEEKTILLVALVMLVQVLHLASITC